MTPEERKQMEDYYVKLSEDIKILREHTEKIQAETDQMLKEMLQNLTPFEQPENCSMKKSGRACIYPTEGKTQAMCVNCTMKPKEFKSCGGCKYLNNNSFASICWNCNNYSNFKRKETK
jgi:hypothetical protein